MNRTESTISLESLARLHGDELAKISHALRTPLTSIIGFASAILNDPDINGETSREFSKIIKAEGERLSRFVDELLYVSFRDSGGSQSHREATDPAQLVQAAIRIVSMKMNQPASRFQAQLQELPPSVYLEREFVIKMLSNVISNAARFSAHDSSVNVSGSATSGHLLVQVASRRRGSNLSLRSLSGNLSPHDSEAIGLARTKHLLSLRGGDLTIQMLHEGTSAINLILAIESAEEPQ